MKGYIHLYIKETPWLGSIHISRISFSLQIPTVILVSQFRLTVNYHRTICGLYVTSLWLSLQTPLWTCTCGIPFRCGEMTLHTAINQTLVIITRCSAIHFFRSYSGRVRFHTAFWHIQDGQTMFGRYLHLIRALGIHFQWPVKHTALRRSRFVSLSCTRLTGLHLFMLEHLETIKHTVHEYH